MKSRTQLLIAALAIITTLFVWWMTIQERTTLLGDPNKKTDSTKVNYSKESMPCVNAFDRTRYLIAVRIRVDKLTNGNPSH